MHLVLGDFDLVLAFCFDGIADLAALTFPLSIINVLVVYVLKLVSSFDCFLESSR